MLQKCLPSCAVSPCSARIASSIWSLVTPLPPLEPVSGRASQGSWCNWRSSVYGLHSDKPLTSLTLVPSLVLVPSVPSACCQRKVLQQVTLFLPCEAPLFRTWHVLLVAKMALVVNNGFNPLNGRTVDHLCFLILLGQKFLRGQVSDLLNPVSQGLFLASTILSLHLLLTPRMTSRWV